MPSASFHYLAPSVPSSLYSDGAVFTVRDEDGSDHGTEGIVVGSRTHDVADARRPEGGEVLTLDTCGFELVSRPLATPDLNFFEVGPVLERYYDECAAIVRETTGASSVHAFDHNVRSADGKKSGERLSGGQQVQAPIPFVHGDYTLSSGPQRLRDLGEAPTANDTYRARLGEGQSLLERTRVERILDGGRFALINVWRNIGDTPVRQDPLALCDARSVDPQDLVVFEIRYSDRVGENYFAKSADRHRWYFYPEMDRDEALLIKQWDSAGTMARSNGSDADGSDADTPSTFSFHSAFADASAPEDAPARCSIEVRCIALFE